jgi:hypothetical protein
MQRTVNKTIGEECFLPPRDYISGTEQNQTSRKTRRRMQRVLGSHGRRVQLKTDCELL